MKKQEGKKKEEGEESKPYLVFQFCKEKCCKCNYCGYVWGPAAPDAMQGQPASWTIVKKDANE